MSTILDKKIKIQSIVNVFETGSIKGDYGNISIYHDGPGMVKQVTYGRSQTTEYGNLKDLLVMYIAKNGKFAADLKNYIGIIGQKPLYNDNNFIEILKEAGSDPIMISTQDEFFDKHYWQPAIKFCDVNGFVTPLAGLVVYDSYIHSGSILSFLRNRFEAKVPTAGGSEQVWITEYLNARKSWLSEHSNPILRKTVYRVNNMLTADHYQDWNLDNSFNANGTNVP